MYTQPSALARASLAGPAPEAQVQQAEPLHGSREGWREAACTQVPSQDDTMHQYHCSAHLA